MPYPTRRVQEKEMIFGLHSVIEAIDAGKVMDKILIRRDLSSTLSKQLLERLSAIGDTVHTTVQRVPVEKLNQLTDRNHQGVIAFLSPVEFYRVEDVIQAAYDKGESPLLMVLDNVTDVRNFGAIARTCACAGAHAIVIGKRGSAPINGDAIKTSAGALHYLPICKVDNMQNALQLMRDSGLSVVAATEHAQQNYTEADMTLPLAILMGNEEKGIYEGNLNLATEQVRIPLHGPIESLNVCVAGGIMLYVAVRQRTFGKR